MVQTRAREASCARCGGGLYTERQGFDIEAYCFVCGRYAGDVVDGQLRRPGALTIEQEIEQLLAAGAPRCVDCGKPVEKHGGHCSGCSRSKRNKDNRSGPFRSSCRDCGTPVTKGSTGRCWDCHLARIQGQKTAAPAGAAT